MLYLFGYVFFSSSIVFSSKTSEQIKCVAQQNTTESICSTEQVCRDSYITMSFVI